MKLNICYLYARVSKKPQIKIQDGEPVYGMCYVEVVRGRRDAHDNIQYTRHDKPLIMSRDREILNEMAKWNENDIVYIKGMLVSKSIDKTSYCDCCTDDEGNPTKNKVAGNLIYINPIHASKVTSFATKEEAVSHIVEKREISNQLYIAGTLCRAPKQIVTKRGIIITQYQIAVNRKYKITTDAPEKKTDFPWVKSYGEQALEDRMRLDVSSDVIIDGFIQARKVTRTTKCPKCENFYHWNDNAMEIVPFAMEYVRGTYKSDDDLEAENKMSIDELRQNIYNYTLNDKIEEDYASEDDIMEEKEKETV